MKHTLSLRRVGASTLLASRSTWRKVKEHRADGSGSASGAAGSRSSDTSNSFGTRVSRRNMTTESKSKSDFRAATESKRPPKAAVDGVAGTILAFAEVSGTPDQAFRALTTDEVEKWWTIPGVYHLKDWKADLHAQGRWSVTVELDDGKQLNEWGEFCEVNVPDKVVMTRRFGANPLLGDRETTLTYRFQPSPHGTLVTLREEGFIGRSEAAYGNAENWEKVLGWLDDYLRGLPNQ